MREDRSGKDGDFDDDDDDGMWKEEQSLSTKVKRCVDRIRLGVRADRLLCRRRQQVKHLRR